MKGRVTGSPFSLLWSGLGNKKTRSFAGFNQPMNIGPYFTLQEFTTNDPIPEACIPAFINLVLDVLNPVRLAFNVPLVVTSGYRSPAANAIAHGQKNSEHMATPRMCAADFYPDSKGLVTARDIFDYMRQNATLPYHQLILEHGSNGSSVVHVSVNLDKVGVRSVLEGATHNSEPYVQADHVAYSV